MGRFDFDAQRGYPEDVDECRAAALEVLSDGRMRGFIASIPANLKPFKHVLK